MKGRILIIDDEPTNVRLLRKVLEANGFDTVAATSGGEGLALARTEVPDLILLDVMMPELDGMQVLSYLQEHESTGHIPVIFISADTSPERKVQGLDAGANDYIGKPFNPDELIARVRTSLRLKKAQDNWRQERRQLSQVASIDSLTGVYNRRYIDERLSEEFDRGRRVGLPLTILLLDIDHFKQVNDTFGHLVGDAVLRDLGRLLRRTLRHTDVVARFGGEEFIAVLPETALEDAVRVAENLRQRVQGHAFGDNGKVRITVSGGVATSPEAGCAGDDVYSLVKRADNRLYRAKRSGRNQVRAAD